MPYEGEYASKSSHSDILHNPEVQQFLAECEYLTPPSDEEAQALAEQFTEPPTTAEVDLPNYVIATDGSNYESSLDEKLPSTKIGYIKIGAMLIKLKDFGALKTGNFVDPFKVAALQNNNSALTFMTPSANINWNGIGNVRDSFRAILDHQLLDEKTRFDDRDHLTSLRSTLFHLASMRQGELGTDDAQKLKLHKCPDCRRGPVELEDIEEQQTCPHCGTPVFPSDCLRLWEEVNDFQSNQVAITRLMMILEHLIPIHYMRHLAQQPFLLSEGAYFVDGPLAVFGNAAWMHRSIMIYLEKLNNRLDRKHGIGPLLMIGLVKTGQVVDHVNFIEKFIPNNRLLAIDDDYRYKYILGGREASGNGFGYETYYGQDFIYKTPTGRTFVFLLPYHTDSKDAAGMNFQIEKTNFDTYPELARAIGLIEHFESDLYRNAVVPVALAHRYTAISLQPGGNVLDILTRQSLGNN